MVRSRSQEGEKSRYLNSCLTFQLYTANEQGDGDQEVREKHTLPTPSPGWSSASYTLCQKPNNDHFRQRFNP